MFFFLVFFFWRIESPPQAKENNTARNESQTCLEQQEWGQGKRSHWCRSSGCCNVSPLGWPAAKITVMNRWPRMLFTNIGADYSRSLSFDTSRDWNTRTNRTLSLYMLHAPQRKVKVFERYICYCSSTVRTRKRWSSRRSWNQWLLVLLQSWQVP